MSNLGIRTGDAFASETSLASKDFKEDTYKTNKYERDKRTKVGSVMRFATLHL